MASNTQKPGKMRGGVRKRGANGKWSYTIDLGLQPAQRCIEQSCHKRVWLTGRRLECCLVCGEAMRDTIERRLEHRGGFENRSDAVRARADAVSDVGKGTHVLPDKVTLGEYLVDKWLPSLDLEVAFGKLRPSTLASYRSHVTHHFAGSKLGCMPLQRLSRDEILVHYEQLRREGRVDGGKDENGGRRPLSASTIRRVHATLHRAMRDAVRSRLLPLNPAGDIELGSGGERRAAWNSAQLHTFLESVREDRLAALWLLYAQTGARRGELLALTWDDVDTDSGKVKIHHTLLEVDREVVVGEPKTKRGRRTLRLDAATVARLKRHRTAQKAERLAAGPKWRDSGYVFTDEHGDRLHPGAVSRTFTELVKRTDLPRISLHGLRHTYATIALVERRQPVSVVSRRLGHKDETVTLTIYSHAREEHDEELADDVASVTVPAGY